MNSISFYPSYLPSHSWSGRVYGHFIILTLSFAIRLCFLYSIFTNNLKFTICEFSDHSLCRKTMTQVAQNRCPARLYNLTPNLIAFQWKVFINNERADDESPTEGIHYISLFSSTLSSPVYGGVGHLLLVIQFENPIWQSDELVSVWTIWRSLVKAFSSY